MVDFEKYGLPWIQKTAAAQGFNSIIRTISVIFLKRRVVCKSFDDCGKRLP
jgi:hypothetical protein